MGFVEKIPVIKNRKEATIKLSVTSLFFFFNKAETDKIKTKIEIG